MKRILKNVGFCVLGLVVYSCSSSTKVASNRKPTSSDGYNSFQLTLYAGKVASIGELPAYDEGALIYSPDFGMDDFKDVSVIVKTNKDISCMAGNELDVKIASGEEKQFDANGLIFCRNVSNAGLAEIKVIYLIPKVSVNYETFNDKHATYQDVYNRLEKGDNLREVADMLMSSDLNLAVQASYKITPENAPVKIFDKIDSNTFFTINPESGEMKESKFTKKVFGLQGYDVKRYKTGPNKDKIVADKSLPFPEAGKFALSCFKVNGKKLEPVYTADMGATSFNNVEGEIVCGLNTRQKIKSFIGEMRFNVVFFNVKEAKDHLAALLKDDNDRKEMMEKNRNQNLLQTFSTKIEAVFGDTNKVEYAKYQAAESDWAKETDRIAKLTEEQRKQYEESMRHKAMIAKVSNDIFGPDEKELNLYEQFFKFDLGKVAVTDIDEQNYVALKMSNGRTGQLYEDNGKIHQFESKGTLYEDGLMLTSSTPCSNDECSEENAKESYFVCTSEYGNLKWYFDQLKATFPKPTVSTIKSRLIEKRYATLVKDGIDASTCSVDRSVIKHIKLKRATDKYEFCYKKTKRQLKGIVKVFDNVAYVPSYIVAHYQGSLGDNKFSVRVRSTKASEDLPFFAKNFDTKVDWDSEKASSYKSEVCFDSETLEATFSAANFKN